MNVSSSNGSQRSEVVSNARPLAFGNPISKYGAPENEESISARKPPGTTTSPKIVTFAHCSKTPRVAI